MRAPVRCCLGPPRRTVRSVVSLHGVQVIDQFGERIAGAEAEAEAVRRDTGTKRGGSVVGA